MSLKLETSYEALDEETFKDNLKDNIEVDTPNDELASKQYPKEFIYLQTQKHTKRPSFYLLEFTS